jgi:acyl carrier protein
MSDSFDSSLIESSLRGFILNEAGGKGNAAKIEGDTKLIESGMLDSLSVLKVVIFIEERFGIKVGADEVIPANFETLGAMVDFVRKKRE